MVTPATIAITPGTGQLLDAVTLTVGSNAVVRETMVIADPSNAAYLVTVTAGGALNVADAVIEACITANVLAVSLPTAQITTLTPPTAAAIASAIVSNPPTVPVTQSTSPWVISGAVTTSGTATVIGTLTHNNAAPVATEIGVLPALANAAAPTFTEGKQVLLSTDLAGNLRVLGTFTGTITGAVTGTLTNNNAAPSTNNLGALTVLANAAAPSWNEGDLVTASSDLAGNTRVILHAETTKVIGAVNQGTSPWIIAGAGTAGSSGTAVLTIQGISGGTVVPVSGTFYQTTQPVSIASGALAAGAAAAGAFADGSIFVRSANASTFPVTATIAASQTIAVTNVGTFLVQAEIEGHAGVALDAVLGATKPANVLQVGGNDGTNAYAIPLASGGGSVVVSGSPSITGVVEVGPTGSANTLSNPFFNVLADNAGHALTVNSTATASKYGLDHNILSILGTAPTTAGFLDIKGADGNVFVRQTSAANLNATVVGTGTFAVQEATLDAALIAQEAATSGVKGITIFGAVTTNAPTYTTAKSDALSLDTSGLLRVSLKDTPANTNSFLVTASIAASQTIAVTNVGTFVVQDSADMSGTTPGTAPSKTLIVGGIYNSSAPGPTTGQTLPFQLDSAGRLIVNVGAGSSGNSAASATGSAVPADADYIGINIAGNLVGQTGLALGATTKAAEVAIVDGSGNQITSFGGGTQYADSAASGATPTGTLSMGWDSANSEVRALKVDASQNLEVNVNAGAINLTDGTHSMTAALSALGTAATGTEVLNVNAYVVGSTLTDPAEATLGGAAPSDTMWVTPSPSPVSAVALTPKPISSTAQAVLKASSGNLYGINLLNLAEVTTTSTVEVMYIHFFNTTTTTSLSTTTWLFCLPIPASTTGSLGNTGQANPLCLPPGAMALANFSAGIVVVINTTSASNTTAAGTAPVGVVWIQ